MIPIPAIDVLDGKAVRLRRGAFTDVTMYDDPLTLARRCADAGVTRLHVVDLDGAKHGRFGLAELLRRITTATSLSVDVGGGMATIDDVRAALDAGVAAVCLGTMVARDPAAVARWASEVGPEHIIAAIDVRADQVMTRGWQDGSQRTLGEVLADVTAMGVGTVMITDIEQDGMLEGPNLALYRDVVARYPGLATIASGGVATAAHLQALAATGCHGAVIGRAWLDGLLPLSTLVGGGRPW